MQTAAIYGIGSFIPPKVLTNEHFSRTLDTSDEWITTRTGIKERHVAEARDCTSDYCLPAAREAVANSGLQLEDIDLIVVGTTSPDFQFPSTACVVQQKLGLARRNIPAFDVSAACSGFLYALATAQAYVCAGMAKRVLVIGAEIITRLLDYTDRRSCILFGDGAGAVVVGPHRTDGPSHPILSTRLFADGDLISALWVRGNASPRPEQPDDKYYVIHLNGREVFRFAVVKAEQMLLDALQRHNLKAEDIGAIVPHQANLRIIQSSAERLKLPLDLFYTNIEKYGNTSAASVPIAMYEAERAGKLKAGKPVILMAFGAGMTWASAVLQW